MCASARSSRNANFCDDAFATMLGSALILIAALVECNFILLKNKSVQTIPEIAETGRNIQ